MRDRARRRGRGRSPSPAAAPCSSPCRRQCLRRSTSPRRPSRRPARFRTDRASSHNPSAWRNRRRARSRRCRRGSTRRSGTGRGGSPTGTAPADRRWHASFANFSAGDLSLRIAATSSSTLPVCGTYSAFAGSSTRMSLPTLRKNPAPDFWPSAPLSISACSTAGALKCACHGSSGKRVAMVLMTCPMVSRPTTSAVR